MIPHMVLGDFAKGGFAELKLVELGDRRRAILRKPLGFSIFRLGEYNRFKRGIAIRAQVSPHKNIVNSIDYGYDFLHPWEIIEYVNGDNLKTH